MKPKPIEQKDPRPNEAPIEEPRDPATETEPAAPDVGEEFAP